MRVNALRRLFNWLFVVIDLRSTDPDFHPEARLLSR